MAQNNANPNRQRDHQANERTYLAWLRTSLALIGVGFAIARFGLFTRQISYALTQHPPPSFIPCSIQKILAWAWCCQAS